MKNISKGYFKEILMLCGDVTNQICSHLLLTDRTYLHYTHRNITEISTKTQQPHSSNT